MSAACNPKNRHGLDTFGILPNPRLLPPHGACPRPPSDETCFALWRKYKMLENIQRHSLLVAAIAENLAHLARAAGAAIEPAAARAAGLLHDIAKTWCIANGGAHAMLGAGWTARETGNYEIAQAVFLHVVWPWPLPEGLAIFSLPIVVLYADKRARHDQCVTLAERFDDILFRYGKTEAAISGINRSWRQAMAIEAAMSRQLQKALHEYSLDCGRLV